jgi:hypothetical protein
MRTHVSWRSHADAIRTDLHNACTRLDEHQQRLQDLLNAIGQRETDAPEDHCDEDMECA